MLYDAKKLAGAVRARRGERTLRDIAYDAGVTHNTLSRIERGIKVDGDTFLRVCTWLDLPWDFFNLHAQAA